MQSHALGFPRIGPKRELKKALEAFWKGEIDKSALEAAAAERREHAWSTQKDAGLDLIPVGDFSFYDQVLDVTAMLGAVPERFSWDGGEVTLETYFHMARGDSNTDAAAMEMTKWFDTNYHYIVPEFRAGQTFKKSTTRLESAVQEAKSKGLNPKPVLVGPVTYLALGKETDEGANRWDYLDAIVDVYAEVLASLASECEWIQIDEPILCTDLSDEARAAFAKVYTKLKSAVGPTKLLLATYFGALEENFDVVRPLPIDALHVDLVRGESQLDAVLEGLPEGWSLSLGLVNGRNIWRVELDRVLPLAKKAVDRLGADRVLIASSCSLQHSPVDLAQEPDLDAEIRAWMAFATQKCTEIATIRDAAEGKDVAAALADNQAAWKSRRAHPLLNDAAVKDRLAALTPDMLVRKSVFAERKPLQEAKLKLPSLPTTTIGSFPQTGEIRKARASFRKGELTQDQYDDFLKDQIRDVVQRQEALDLDVLVHGEPERNDMVEYFGQQMAGFCFTRLGWVQSYGSRCVKPPIIFGDVSRPTPMTVDWSKFAQSCTSRPMKGMLTGPVTILCWSFVRDDVPRETVCKQLALAVRDEVVDLETAGVDVIQIDEAALREGMPLRARDRDAYLTWAIDSFRITASGVADTTQIHTHMCYSEFNSIAEWIAKMDADVISIEASRSRMDLLDAFRNFQYPNDIGPGVYDIHSPRVPSTEEMVELLRKALDVIPLDRLWVNPDCGLKTRGWPEATASLENMVKATKQLREELVPAS